MSEDNVITRQEKTKDPRRVEAGKRLGAISKEARERKARERFAMETINEETEDQTEASSIDIQSVLTIGFISAVIIGRFYFSNMKHHTSDPEPSATLAGAPASMSSPTLVGADATFIKHKPQTPNENTKTMNFISFDE